MISALILDTAAAIDEVAREEAALFAGIAEGRLTHHAVTAARVVITARRHEIATQLWSLARRASEHGLPSPGFDLARASDAAHVVTSPKWATCLRDWHRELERRRGASCPKADPASEGDDETDIIIAGRQVPFVQVGMIVHPDDCLNCERDGSPLWCSALVCDIHDDDETARFGMMATLLFRNGERREEPCDELRRRWRLARDFDQGRVYTGRWGTIPRGSVWPVAEVNEDA